MTVSEFEAIERKIVRRDRPALPTILIVDDDELVLARLQLLVGAAGYDVRTATGVGEALRKLDGFAASIVVTDFNMADASGLELCRCIRKRRFSEYVYILLFTVRDSEKDILAAFEAGADDYVTKRTSGIQFLARLRTAKRVLALENSLHSALAKTRQVEINDPLTGVYNRRYFFRHFSRELKRTQRFGGYVSLLLIEIDHLKEINDTYGYPVGDLVLKKFTKLVAGRLRRETDWCARLAKKTFAVVLEGAMSADAHTCAEIVRRTIADSPIDTSVGPIRITISIGISGFEGKEQRVAASVQSLLKQANTNLYASVLSGRNRVTLSDPIYTGVVTLSSHQSPGDVVLNPAGPPGPSRHIRH
jgi:two-component system cell cycle response regulator